MIGRRLFPFSAMFLAFQSTLVFGAPPQDDWEVGATDAMKSNILSIITFAVAAFSGSLMAQESVCPKDLTWRDAVYAQRSVNINGQLITAKVENFFNVWAAEIEEGLNRSAIISVRAQDGSDAITLTFGQNRPKPTEFSEIGMAVESPMGDGSWPRMRSPCDLKDGSSVEFNETDLPASGQADLLNAPAFHGAMQRHGTEFSYALKSEANGNEPASTWQGKLRYGSPTRDFDLATDVQGWHVYRANSFVKTIPLGKPVPLSSVLSEMVSTTK